MASFPDYTLRFMQYLDLMLLFGLPLFAWYGPTAFSGDKRFPPPRWSLTQGLLICGVLGLARAGIELVRSTAGIMRAAVSGLARRGVAWCRLGTRAGRRGLSRPRRVGRR